jgi:predicted MFS family arabinose efflux permease
LSAVRLSKKFDWQGALFFVPAIMLILIGLTGGAGYVSEGLRAALVGAGVMLLLGFVRLQRSTEVPLLPLDIFHYPNVRAGLLSMAIVMAASAGLFILPSLVMQKAMGWSPAQSGMGMLPHSLTVILMGQMIGWLMGRFSLRTNVLSGLALLVSGTFLNGWMGPSGGYLFNVLVPMVLGAAGSIFTVIMLTAVVTGQQPAHQQGVVSAIAFTSQQVGIALGSVILLVVAGGGDNPFGSLNHAFLASSLMALTSLGIMVAAYQFRSRADAPTLLERI